MPSFGSKGGGGDANGVGAAAPRERVLAAAVLPSSAVRSTLQLRPRKWKLGPGLNCGYLLIGPLGYSGFTLLVSMQR